MNQELIDKVVNRIKDRIVRLDVPKDRQGDLRWIERNLLIRNKGELAQRVLFDTRWLLKQGVDKI